MNVNVLVVLPIGNNEPLARPALNVVTPGQSSLPTAENVTIVPFAPVTSYTTMFAFNTNNTQTNNQNKIIYKRTHTE